MKIKYNRCNNCTFIERITSDDYPIECADCHSELEVVTLGDGKLFAPEVVGKENALLYENMLLSIANKNGNL